MTPGSCLLDGKKYLPVGVVMVTIIIIIKAIYHNTYIRRRQSIVDDQSNKFTGPGNDADNSLLRACSRYMWGWWCARAGCTADHTHEEEEVSAPAVSCLCCRVTQ
jgi:hypothetical protein